ncbi:alpha/beta-hydrolase [Ramicandelaber brevisporus]|nr:alpha/beta-hydrolase [Ramicandelaber brevisporus]
MLELILGYTSARLKRLELFLVAAAFVVAIRRSPRYHISAAINLILAKYSPVQIALSALLASHLFHNVLTTVGLHSPEAVGRLYNKGWYRASTLYQALVSTVDTVSGVPTSLLRLLATPAVLMYYILHPTEAINRGRLIMGSKQSSRVRHHFNIGANPIVRFTAQLAAPRLGVRKTLVNLDQLYRQNAQTLGLPPLAAGEFLPSALLMFNDTEEEMQRTVNLIFHIHGGGWFAMSPEMHSDYTAAYAKRTGAVVISADYAKTPDHPFPVAHNQLWALYRLIAATNGACIGMNINSEALRVIITGDSAGGGLTLGLTKRIVEHNLGLARGTKTGDVKVLEPIAIVPVYPGVDFETRLLIKPEHLQYFDTKFDSNGFDTSSIAKKRQPEDKPPAYYTAFSLYGDDIVVPRHLLVQAGQMYGGSHLHPQHKNTDMEPLYASDDTLENWNMPALFVVGELDPLMDHTVIFSGRLRDARRRRQRQLSKSTSRYAHLPPAESDPDVQTVVFKGISHGFISFSSLYAPSRQIVDFVGRYMADAFYNAKMLTLDPRVGESGIPDVISMANTSISDRHGVLAQLDTVKGGLLESRQAIAREAHFL